jgi:hypothetical protein
MFGTTIRIKAHATPLVKATADKSPECRIEVSRKKSVLKWVQAQ